MWWYAIDENGNWIYRTGSIRRAKGWGKSPLLGALCIIEFCGPCRFSHWDEEGNPVGIPEYSPEVQIAATSLEQTGNTMKMVRGMLVASKLRHELGLDIGKAKIQFKDGRPGSIEPVTSNSTTLEGGRPTFAVLDESHLMTASNGGHYLFEVIDRNVGKNPGGRARYLESTNAYNPNQDSVAQRTHEAVQLLDAPGVQCDKLYDCVEASPVTEDFNLRAPENEAKVRELIREAYGDSTWVDEDTIYAKICDVRIQQGIAFRFYLNNIQATADAWITKDEWVACKELEDPLKKRDQIALGFDGSLYDDATALVACRLRDGKLFVLGVWEKGQDDGPDWEVDTRAVDATLYKAFKDYRVAWVYADPYLWQDVIDRWAAEFGKKIIFKFPTNRERPMFEALERFQTAVRKGELKHDGNPILQRHVLNAVMSETRAGYIIQKEKPKSPKKIDAAMAAVLAYEAYGDALQDGRYRSRTGSRVVGM